MKMIETKWTAVQTTQGTWVRRADGATDPRRAVNVAQVYAPPSHESPGATLDERVESSEKATLDVATLMAGAPELAAMLRTLVESHWREAPHETTRSLVRQAEALLTKVGG
jgi:hypothetical protein